MLGMTKHMLVPGSGPGRPGLACDCGLLSWLTGTQAGHGWIDLVGPGPGRTLCLTEPWPWQAQADWLVQANQGWTNQATTLPRQVLTSLEYLYL